ncbi:MAG: Xaa-Pro dipeptidase [Candidatus Methanomethylophilaceae archaeon]|nr:Xaa-Pro dipeptidase [Candidatus Methanomethylophilaceae archaeon]
MFSSRAERLTGNAPDVDAIVILNGQDPFLDSTFWYLTEQNSGTFEGGIAIVRDGRLDVIVSSLEAECAKEGRGEIHEYRDREDRNNILKGLLDGCGSIGFNVHSAPYSSVEYVRKLTETKVVDATKSINDTVSVKDEKEIEAIRRACMISSKVAEEIPGMLKADITEKDVAAMMDNRMRELGGEGNAFETIAAFGRNASMPHHSPTEEKLKKGDVALFDFGTKFNRYCSDMTRTVFFGEPKDVLKRAYMTVKEAQEVGFQCYRDGAPAAEADVEARKVIDAGEFKGRMIHTFGHGIGMDVHEAISIYCKSEQILKSGNVVSAEPGIYLPGVGGIRIEDTCLVKAGGAERLTSFDRELTIV